MHRPSLWPLVGCIEKIAKCGPLNCFGVFAFSGFLRGVLIKAAGVLLPRDSPFGMTVSAQCPRAVVVALAGLDCQILLARPPVGARDKRIACAPTQLFAVTM